MRNYVTFFLVLFLFIIQGHARSESFDCTYRKKVLDIMIGKKQPIKTEAEEFSQCKKDPNSDAYIFVYLVPSTYDEGVVEYDLLIAVGNSLRSLVKLEEKSSFISDAVFIDNMTIDTARYSVSEGKRAFGIRVSSRNSSSVNAFQQETISLFLLAGNKIENVLRKLITSQYMNESSGGYDCVFNATNTSTLISMGKTKHYGAYDMILSVVEKNELATKPACRVLTKKSKMQMVIEFNGKEYKPIRAMVAD